MDKRVVLLGMFFCLMVACAKQPTMEEMSKWDYGPYPDNYEQIVKDAMLTRLVDPYSAQYHFQGTPKRSHMAQSFGRETIYGWGGVVLINAKNRLGGYVGATKFAYIIRNGKLILLEENFREQ